MSWTSTKLILLLLNFEPCMAPIKSLQVYILPEVQTYMLESEFT